MSDTMVVSTTLESKDDASRLADLLLEKRLIACAQISGPVESLYWWKGKVERAIEYKLAMKSRRNLWLELERIIRLNHPYDVPEIIATSNDHISHDYEQWLVGELKR